MRNKILKAKELGITIVIVALVGALLFTACAPSGSIETTKKVPIAWLAPLTGGAGPATQVAFQGFQDYIRYFNEEEGIPGITIQFLWRDTMTARDPAISGYAALMERNVVIMLISSVSDIRALWSRLETDQVPILNLAMDTNDLIDPPGWVFSVWPTSGEMIGPMLDHFMENWKEDRPPKLSLFILDGPYGWPAADDITPYAEKIGYEVLPIEVCPYIVIDASTQLIRIKANEADLVFLQQIVTEIGPVLRDAQRLELLDEIQFASTDSGMGDAVLQLAGGGAESLLCCSAMPWFDQTQIPGIKTFLDKQLEYHGKVVEDSTILMGWIYAALMCEVVKLAVEDVGYENIDGLTTRRVLESMDFDVDGIVRITFGPEDRRGVTKYAVYQIRGKQRVRVSDYREIPMIYD